MKVMLLVNNPQHFFPSYIPPSLTEYRNFPHNRTGEILEHIKKAATGNLIYLTDFSKELFEFDKIYTIQAIEDNYYTLNLYNGQIASYHITDVETDKPWTIVPSFSNRGMERIYYIKDNEIDDYVLLDESLMYYEKLSQ